MTADLLTLAEIADMHHCNRARARDVIVKLPGFPAPTPTSTPRNRLWLRRDVEAFLSGDCTQGRTKHPKAERV